MGKSVVRVDPEIISEMVFQGRVEVLSARMDAISGVIEFEIAGPDVPDAERCDCLITNPKYEFVAR